jgi:hypothetical protein
MFSYNTIPFWKMQENYGGGKRGLAAGLILSLSAFYYGVFAYPLEAESTMPHKISYADQYLCKMSGAYL